MNDGNLRNTNLKWKYGDPRNVYINSDIDIIIVRPSTERKYEVAIGLSCTDDDSWYIYTGFKDHPYISANDDWDRDWRWIEWIDNSIVEERQNFLTCFK
jgi:hypothetical protein